MSRQLSLAQQAILEYVRDHPGCGKAEVARVTSFGQGASTERERMRMLAIFMDRGLLRSSVREARAAYRPFALHLTKRGEKALGGGVNGQ